MKFLPKLFKSHACHVTFNEINKVNEFGYMTIKPKNLGP